jgi:hypothetical protein
MTKYAPRAIVGGLTLGLAIWFLAATGSAADEERATVSKIADLIAKNDMDGAKKEAAALAKKAELEDVMQSFKPRLKTNKGGFGIGPKPGAIQPDSIELKIGALAKKAPTAGDLKSQSDALTEMAYRTAAISLYAQEKAPAKKAGAKDPKDWKQWSEDLTKSSLELAAAIKKGDAKAINTAAKNANAACNNCHGVFRD